ncbi:unnamed protein product [Ectocarpus sp. CCAP 1310/34]|nr:unnamed protein product [Ectocarpus sp. CCAP 1310/34]
MGKALAAWAWEYFCTPWGTAEGGLSSIGDGGKGAELLLPPSRPPSQLREPEGSSGGNACGGAGSGGAGAPAVEVFAVGGGAAGPVVGRQRACWCSIPRTLEGQSAMRLMTRRRGGGEGFLSGESTRCTGDSFRW